MKDIKQQLRKSSGTLAKYFIIPIQIIILSVAALIPFLSQNAYAITTTQLSPRQATVSTSQPSATTSISFIFDLPGGTQPIQGIIVEFCDQAIGACTSTNTPTLPTTNAVATPTINAKWTDSTVFAAYARSNGTDGGTNNQFTITRTSATNETTTGAGCDTTYPVVAANCRSLTISGLTNNSGSNVSYYPRLRLYTVNAAFDDTVGTGNQAYYGSVAQATTQTLTVNARVQEHLEFCVGTTGVDDNVGVVAANCAAVTGTTVDIGTIDNVGVYKSPVSVASGGSNTNGVAMIRSNGSNGTVISFFTQQDTSSGLLKVAGAACIGAGSVVDKCFNDPGATANTSTLLVAGTEAFGVEIGTVNTQSVSGAYAGSNITPDAQYYGDAGCTGTACTKFAWNDTTTAYNIASSAASSVKVLNNEALILKFAATAAATTPTGQYTVASTYIATSTY